VSKLKIFIEGIRNFKDVGPVTRSSPSLAKKMVSFINKNDKSTIIELGDGAVVHNILDKVSEDSILLLIELNNNPFRSLNKK
jgi:phospholipid N-methyltransferase